MLPTPPAPLLSGERSPAPVDNTGAAYVEAYGGAVDALRRANEKLAGGPRCGGARRWRWLGVKPQKVASEQSAVWMGRPLQISSYPISIGDWIVRVVQCSVSSNSVAQIRI